MSAVRWLFLFVIVDTYNIFRELYALTDALVTDNFPQGLPEYYEDRLRVTPDWLAGSFKQTVAHYILHTILYHAKRKIITNNTLALFRAARSLQQAVGDYRA